MEKVYLLNTDTTHSETKPSEYAEADGTRVYIERPSGRVIVAQTYGAYTAAQAAAEIGTTYRIIADQSNRDCGTGRVVGIASELVRAGRIPTTKGQFYVYK